MSEDEIEDEIADEVSVEEEVPEMDEPAASNRNNIVSFSNFGGSNLVGVGSLLSDDPIEDPSKVTITHNAIVVQD